MKRQIKVPEGVEFNCEGLSITLRNKNGTVAKDFRSPFFSKHIKIEKNGENVIVSCDSDKKKIKAMVGTIAALILAHSKGLLEGYTYKLKIAYIHFPFTVKVDGKNVLINNFLGEKSTRKANILGETKVNVKGDEIVVNGHNLDDVSQTAANIETATRLSGRDRRVFQDGCYIINKSEKE